VASRVKSSRFKVEEDETLVAYIHAISVSRTKLLLKRPLPKKNPQSFFR
jgi:hypothetical protein